MNDSIAQDVQARQRALDPAASFIVQAPAGSGKTELLIQRFLVLLAGVDQPEEILAITFTRKASTEMRTRLVRALESAQQPQPEEVHKRETWDLARKAMARDAEQGWQILDHPLRLRVRTVDGFCSGLTRRMPWLSRLGDAPRTTDEARSLYEEAAGNLLRRVFTGEIGSELVSHLLLHRGNNLEAVKGLLADMLARRDQWLRHVVGQGEDAREYFEEALADVVQESLDGLASSMPGALLPALLEVADFAGSHCPEDSRDALIRDLEGLIEAPTDRHGWEALATLLLTGKGEWRKKSGLKIGQGFPAASSVKGDKEKAALYKAKKEQMGSLLDEFGEHSALRIKLDAVRNLPPEQYDDDQWELLQTLTVLLPLAVAELRLVFSVHGEVDHIEQALAALDALGGLGAEEGPSDLALALDYQLRHILMDEFQDTSHSQYRLLQRLVEGWQPDEGRSLFLVGDPMQSIYRFREADVGLFLRAKEEGIGQVFLEYLRLSRNFRSRPGVVNWVNEVFSGVMPANEDPLLGAVSYSASLATRDADNAPNVQVHGLMDRAAEADKVADLAIQALSESEGTVAILVRARSHLLDIVAALRAKGQPYQAVDIDPLFKRPVVQDLWSLTRALLHRQDRVAWFSVLRAPWMGLRLVDLQALSDGAGGRDLLQTVMEFDDVPGLSEEAIKRLQRIRPWIEMAVKALRRKSLRQVIESLWLRLGGPACYPAAEAAEADRYLELLGEWQEGGSLPDLPAMQQRLDKLYAAADSQADGRLQIMTLHKSKGLEFDTVILPGLDRKPRNQEAKLLVWLERHGGLGGLMVGAIKAQGQDDDPVYGYIQSVEKERAQLETGRALYVAVTRARERLHLLASIPCKEKDGEWLLGKPVVSSYLGSLWSALEADFEAALEAQKDSFIEVAEEDERSQALFRLPETWSLPEAPEPPASLNSQAAPVDEAAVDFEWARPLARDAGTVVHRYLQAMSEQGVAHWDHARVESVRDASRAMLMQLGTAPDDVDTALERVMKSLHQVLDDERGLWILGPRDEAGCEVSLSGILDDRLVNRIVDRTFVDKGERWIVDYKTGSHEGGDLQGFLDAEEARYRDQLLTYGRLYEAMEDRPVRLALYFPLMQAFREVTPGP